MMLIKNDYTDYSNNVGLLKVIAFLITISLVTVGVVVILKKPTPITINLVILMVTIWLVYTRPLFKL